MDEPKNIIIGRNAVREAIKSGRSIDRLYIQEGAKDGSINEIQALAQDRRIMISRVTKQKLEEMLVHEDGGRPVNHQGVLAAVPMKDYCSIEDILSFARARNEQPFVLLLDSIQDPHNLGAIIRSAHAMGVHGIILPKRRSAPLNVGAYKASAGAMEYMNIAKAANLTDAIKKLKKEGLWVLGADASGSPLKDASLEGSIALVIGSEGEGISRLVKENCDMLISIPMTEGIGSLNASVAAGILMYEYRRQRM